MEIDIEALRSYLLDLCGTAMTAGFVPALMDVAEVENASNVELLSIAFRLGAGPASLEVR